MLIAIPLSFSLANRLSHRSIFAAGLESASLPHPELRNRAKDCGRSCMTRLPPQHRAAPFALQ
jgi:hypothetical protein